MLKYSVFRYCSPWNSTKLTYKIYFQVAHDEKFLEHTLQNALQVDEFTANLYDIWVKVRQEGITQVIMINY